jgi:hypothetical protein
MKKKIQKATFSTVSILIESFRDSKEFQELHTHGNKKPLPT